MDIESCLCGKLLFTVWTPFHKRWNAKHWWYILHLKQFWWTRISSKSGILIWWTLLRCLYSCLHHWELYHNIGKQQNRIFGELILCVCSIAFYSEKPLNRMYNFVLVHYQKRVLHLSYHYHPLHQGPRLQDWGDHNLAGVLWSSVFWLDLSLRSVTMKIHESQSHRWMIHREDVLEVLEVFESWKTGSAVFISLLATPQIP